MNEKMIQNYLILLLHAHKCLKKIDSERNCQIKDCCQFRELLMHINECTLLNQKNCIKMNCNLGKQLLFHWINCKNSKCSICLPIKSI